MTLLRTIFYYRFKPKLLASEIATALRGRTISYTLYPLSFREYLNFQGITHDLYLPEVSSKIANEFGKYIVHGGYPELINTNKDVQFKTLQE
jgi:uncharacterized protein